MISPKRFLMLVAAAIAMSAAMTGLAQAQVVPNDVSNPASDAGIPALLTGANTIIRPQDLAVLQFDALLDPTNGADPARLSAAAQSIRQNQQACSNALLIRKAGHLNGEGQSFATLVQISDAGNRRDQPQRPVPFAGVAHGVVMRAQHQARQSLSIAFITAADITDGVEMRGHAGVAHP